MYKACSKCGKIHPISYKCRIGITYKGGIERELRNTNDWHKKAKEIKEKSNYLCSICKEEGRYIYTNTEVHHIEKVKNAPNKLLDDYNLICLCIEHHKLADNNKIDKEYLKELVNKREGML